MSVADVGPDSIDIVQQVPHQGEVVKVVNSAIHPHMMAALSSQSHRLCVWDLPKYPRRAAGPPLPSYTMLSTAKSEVLSFDYSYAIAGGLRNGSILIWRPGLEGEVLPANEWQAHESPIVDLKWNCQRQELLASISEVNCLRIDDLHHNSRLVQTSTQKRPSSFSWNRVDPNLAAISTSFGVDLWDVRVPGTLIHHIPISRPLKVEWSPHIQGAFAVASDNYLMVYDCRMFCKDFQHKLAEPVCDFSWSNYWESMISAVDQSGELNILKPVM